MNLKEQFLAYLAEDEDRLTDLTPEQISQALGGADVAEVARLRTEEIVRQTAENIKERPQLSFHAIKNLYPFPTSEEVNRAKQLLDPSFVPEVRKKH